MMNSGNFSLSFLDDGIYWCSFTASQLLLPASNGMGTMIFLSKMGKQKFKEVNQHA